MSTASAAARIVRPSSPLSRLNPLTAIFAVLPVIVAVLFTRTVTTPLAIAALGGVVLLVAARPRPRVVVFLLVVLPLFVAVLSVSFGVWTDAASVAETPVVARIGAFTFYWGALETGIATALRLAALIVLALLCTVASSGTDLVRACVTYLRMPYRIGYTALAAFRFVPRFGHELELIRQAHRVRGMAGGRGPVGAVRRAAGYVIPLLAGAIRHAERVALAMDARAFGAHPTRTERHQIPLRIRDLVCVVSFWAASATIFAATIALT